jgi:uncharacterized protein
MKTISNTPLSDAELDELDHILPYELDGEEQMMVDMLDGYLHAIAIGPTTLMPGQWLPAVFGKDAKSLPPARAFELVLRRFNDVLASFEEGSDGLNPLWNERIYRGRYYDDAEGWAVGFVDGMQLCLADWQPMLDTDEGKRWYRPIELLGAMDAGPDQERLTRTPAMRAKLALKIPESLWQMYAHWLPLRIAVAERQVAQAVSNKVGRNEMCPCNSGKKFKKCCGAAGVLH